MVVGVRILWTGRRNPDQPAQVSTTLQMSSYPPHLTTVPLAPPAVISPPASLIQSHPLLQPPSIPATATTSNTAYTLEKPKLSICPKGSPPFKCLILSKILDLIK